VFAEGEELGSGQHCKPAQESRWVTTLQKNYTHTKKKGSSAVLCVVELYSPTII